MLRMQIIGLALVSALAMGAVAVSSASAEEFLHQWLIGGKLLASPVKVHLIELLLLEDSKAMGGAVRVHCHRFGTGTVGPHGLDLVESITLELLGKKDLVLCLFDKVGLCKEGTMPVYLAVNLPRLTELVLHGTQLRDLLLADGNGAPGWRITCENILGGKTEDTCTEEPGSPVSISVGNVLTAAMGVNEVFDEITPTAQCSVGGPKAGIVSGTILVESPSAKAEDSLLVD